MPIIVGSNGADALTGSVFFDLIYGLGGKDDLRGVGGNDEIRGGSGNDFMLGAGGNDTLTGGTGEDRLIGSSGNDVINAVGFGTDGSGSDILSCGSGDDQATIGIGDVADGGTGEDTFTFFSDFSGNVKYTLDLSRIHQSPPSEFGLGAQTKVGGFENAIINLSNSGAGSSVVGSIGNDVISGPGFSLDGIRMDGGAGNDVLNATAGADTLIGGEGLDQIFGGGGRDVMTGGKGGDLFGYNTFQIAGQPPASDVIRDFKSGVDFLYITGALAGPGSINFDLDNYFVSGRNPTADAATAQFLFDTDAKKLLLDLDGTGSNAAFEFCSFSRLSAQLLAKDVVLDF
jgi:Ca2+-binding RTX toxin-like protein